MTVDALTKQDVDGTQLSPVSNRYTPYLAGFLVFSSPFLFFQFESIIACILMPVSFCHRSGLLHITSGIPGTGRPAELANLKFDFVICELPDLTTDVHALVTCWFQRVQGRSL